MKLKRFFALLSLLLITLCFSLKFSTPDQVYQAQKDLPQSIYIWQRRNSPALQQSIEQNAQYFDEIVYLGAEIQWLKTGQPQIIFTDPPHLALSQSQRRISIAVRVGAWSDQGDDDQRVDLIIQIIKQLHDQARILGLNPKAIHLDMDCYESRLDDYATWSRQIIRSTDLPLWITALPAWLDRPSFYLLAHAADGYILQVHSLQRPTHAKDQIPLCDPYQARRAATLANRIGVPYIIALPTYGYDVAFDRDGQFKTVIAEESIPVNSPSLQWLRVEANPMELAILISQWQKSRPKHMQGIIWYRLPLKTDRLNWAMSTLKVVMHGKAPAPIIFPEARSDMNGLIQLEISNQGNANAKVPEYCILRFTGKPPLASDLHGPYRIISKSHEDQYIWTLRLRDEVLNLSLKPNQTIAIGWLRFTTDTEVEFNAFEHSHAPGKP